MLLHPVIKFHMLMFVAHGNDSIAYKARIKFAKLVIHWLIEATEEMSGWAFFILTDLFYPGWVTEMVANTRNVNLVAIEVDAAIVDHLMHPKTHGRNAIPDDWKDEAGPKLPVLGRSIPLDVEINIRRTQDGALLLYCLIVSSIVERATVKNISSFYTERIQSLGRHVGLWPARLAQMTAQKAPDISILTGVNSFFWSRNNLRKCVVKELIYQTHEAKKTKQITLLTDVVKLWRNAGMTHINVIHDMIEVFGETLSEWLPGVQGEVVEFQKACPEGHSSGGLGPHYALVNPERVEAFHSQKYPELLRLARVFATRLDNSYENFAAYVGESKYKTRFLAMFDVLTREYLTDEDEDITQSLDLSRKTISDCQSTVLCFEWYVMWCTV